MYRRLESMSVAKSNVSGYHVAWVEEGGTTKMNSCILTADTAEVFFLIRVLVWCDHERRPYGQGLIRTLSIVFTLRKNGHSCTKFEPSRLTSERS